MIATLDLLPPKEQNHADVEQLIYSTIHAFKKRTASSEQFDELLSVAGLAYAKAARSYSRAGGRSFASWIRLKVWHGLMDKHRKDMRRAGIVRIIPFSVIENERKQDNQKAVEFEDEIVQQDSDTFNPDSLTPDAAQVVKLVLNPPPDVSVDAVLQDENERPGSLRSAVIQYLQDIGWSFGRILESLREIGDALR